MKRKLIIATLAIVAMWGCTKQEQRSSNEQSLVAKFSNSTITKVSGTEWEEDDHIGVMVTTGSALHTDYRYNNCYKVSFTDDATQGSFTAYAVIDQIYYSVEESDYIHFYAYYPYNANLVEEEESYTVNVETQTTPRAIDFMEASTSTTSGYNKNSDPVALNFSRNMSKITLKLQEGGTGVEIKDITAVTFSGFYTEATYLFATNSFGDFKGADVNITPYDEGSDIYSAILIPENSTSHTVYFTLDNGEDVPLDLTQYTLSKGKHYYFTVTVHQTEVSCDENKIEGWDEANIGDSDKTFETE